jgi:chorismate mutase/prephenate dehydratase
LKEIKDLRNRINDIDEQIIALLTARFETAEKIGRLKTKNNAVIYDPQREIQVLDKVKKLAQKAGLERSEITHLFQHIIALCRQVQGDALPVVYLGPKGTFCEQAAHSFFDIEPTMYIDKNSIKEIFRSVSSGEAEFGVVPVENSIEGSVNIVLDLLLESGCMVYGEVEEKIRHNLLAPREVTFNNIKTVISHPQALSQCRPYLEENFPNVKLVESSSTAAAVKRVSKLSHAAAIGTELAAQFYNMQILARGIEAYPHNYTRFLVIATKDHTPTGKDRTSIIFSLPHTPGALQKALKPFSSRNLNLTKIESRPTRNKPWEYLFYCDFKGHRLERLCSEAIQELESLCAFLKVIGSYPRAN